MKGSQTMAVEIEDGVGNPIRVEDATHLRVDENNNIHAQKRGEAGAMVTVRIERNWLSAKVIKP